MTLSDFQGDSSFIIQAFLNAIFSTRVLPQMTRFKLTWAFQPRKLSSCCLFPRTVVQSTNTVVYDVPWSSRSSDSQAAARVAGRTCRSSSSAANDMASQEAHSDRSAARWRFRTPGRWPVQQYGCLEVEYSRERAVGDKWQCNDRAPCSLSATCYSAGTC